MDKVIQTEFNKQFPFILSRAIISTAMKTVSQYYAQKELGDLGGFAVALYQIATTSADTRIWNTLPKEFQVAKIKVPKNNIVQVGVNGVRKLEINVAENKNSLIFIKQPTTLTNMVYDVIEL